MTQATREANRYSSHCMDCGKFVEAGEGRLYRHHGANLTGKLRRSRPRKGNKYVYVVRCGPCYLLHDKPKQQEVECPWPDPIYRCGYDYACGYLYD